MLLWQKKQQQKQPQKLLLLKGKLTLHQPEAPNRINQQQYRNATPSGVAFYLPVIHPMKMFSFDDCIKIGMFRKPHGIAGTLELVFEPEWEVSVQHAEIFITETDGLPVPWFVAPDGVRITSSKSALVDLDWIDNQDSAKKLCGNPVCILKKDIIPDMKPQELSEWSGFTLYNEYGYSVGKINKTENFSGNMVMMVDTPVGEKMVPFHPDLIVEINRETRSMTVRFPEGLLDI
jgi:16S rRNA processing protein RimM